MSFDHLFDHRTQKGRRNRINFHRFALKVFAAGIGRFRRARLQIQQLDLLRRNADNLKANIGIRREDSKFRFDVLQNVAYELKLAVKISNRILGVGNWNLSSNVFRSHKFEGNHTDKLKPTFVYLKFG